MLIKTSDLIGPALDWAVAKAAARQDAARARFKASDELTEGTHE